MKKTLILIIYLFLGKCISKPEIVPLQLQAEELEVIKATFTDSVSYWQRINYRHILPAKNGSWSGKIVWFVIDTLYNPAHLSPGNIYPHVPRINPRVKLDTTYYHLEKQLYTNLYPKQAAKISGLIIGNYTFYSIDSVSRFNKSPKRYLNFSRVVFNQQHTKACYYVSQSFPENHAANGDILYAEKRNGKWYLIYRNLNWVT